MPRPAAASAASAGRHAAVPPGATSAAPAPPAAAGGAGRRAAPLPRHLVTQYFKKTRPCRFWPGCVKGDSCSWAHGNDDLRSGFDFTKSKMCAGWSDGRCKLDPKDCKFAHGPHELRGVRLENSVAAAVPAAVGQVSPGAAPALAVPPPPGLEPPAWGPAAAEKGALEGSRGALSPPLSAAGSETTLPSFGSLMSPTSTMQQEEGQPVDDLARGSYFSRAGMLPEFGEVSGPSTWPPSVWQEGPAYVSLGQPLLMEPALLQVPMSF